MDTLTLDALLEIVSYLRPQTHLNSLVCVATWLTKNINTMRKNNSWKPGGQGRFGGIHQLTPFQKLCLEELYFNRYTSVTDYDNALIVGSTLCAYLSSVQQTDGYLEVCFAPPQEFNENYCVHVCNYPLPVDEYTPVWVYKSFAGMSARGEQLHFFCNGDLFLSKEGVVQVGGIPLFQGLAYVNYNETITYKQLEKYHTFVCNSESRASRIASLLMQFSPTIKRILITTDVVAPAETGIVPTKKYFQYCTEVHDMDAPVHRSRLRIERHMSVAQHCVASLGYDATKVTEYERWIEKHTGKQIQLPLTSQYLSTLEKYWVLIDPRQDWSDTVKVKSSKALFYPEEYKSEKKALKELKASVQFSLSTTRGGGSTGALTLAQVKEACRKHGLKQTGTRQQLLVELKNHLDTL